MTLLFLKIAVSALSVLILGFIADRGNPRLAGILTGFPIGTAIVVSFIAIENGPVLASQSSLYSLAALSINPIFAYAYFVIGSRLPGEFSFKTNLALALIVYFVVAAGVANISWSFISATLFLLATTIIVNFLLRTIPASAKSNSVTATPGVLFVRMLLAALVVVAVTEMLDLVGPRWSGVFSPFPVTLVPLLVILHSNHGRSAAFVMIKGFGVSFLSTGIYLACVTKLFPDLGVLYATLIGFGCAGIYLGGLEFLKASTPPKVRNRADRHRDNLKKESE